ncbi:MAG TPA: hypothetical protein VEK15_09950 [Vicinamibacteria bacterium]|nr:hypothetical protein [Vicinamibacteria bacterium]
MDAATRCFAAVVALLYLLGCGSDPAQLTVELVEPATATPQFFHGNCFAGYSVAVGLRVRETSFVGVFLDSLSYRVVDEGTGFEIASDVLDRATIDERYGAMASVLVGGGSRVYPLGGRSDDPVGPLLVSGEIAGRDENGNNVRTSFNLRATLNVIDPEPPGSGACVVN